jgi:hypothetical protein
MGNPDSQDFGFWTTGNAWAAWGMLRVLVTMMHSEYREAMEAQKQDLQNWIVEILQASYPHTNVSHLRSSPYTTRLFIDIGPFKTF